MSAPRPPRLWEALLRLCLPPGPVREGVLGDLSELHARRAADGRLRARWLYAVDVVRVGFRFLGARLGRATRSTSSGFDLMPLVQDLRYAVRTLFRRPAFTLLATFTIALGVGATTAVYAVVDAIVLSPLPFEEPEEIVAIWGDRFAGTREVDFLARTARSFEAVAAWSPGWGSAITGAAEPTRVDAVRVSANFFPLLGVEPEGRGFRPGEDAAEAARVVVISHRLWNEQFGGDPGALGRTLTIDRTPYQVVGIAPRDFGLLGVPRHDLWIPISMDPSLWIWDAGVVQMIGRLADGVTLEQANREMDALAPRMRQAFGEGDRYAAETDGVLVAERAVGDVRAMLWLILGAVAFLLSIAGANVAGLMIARGLDRRGEIALRISLGAERGRVLGQLVVETGVLAALGGLVGMASAAVGLRSLVALLPSDTPRLAEIAIDARVVTVSALALALVALGAGLVAALTASRGVLQGSLRGYRADGAGASRLRNAFVVSQVALAMVLLVGAGLMTRSLARMAAVDPGFRTDGVLTLSLQVPGSVDAAHTFASIAEAVRRVPGVSGAVTTQHFPIKDVSWTAAVRVEGQELERRSELPRATFRAVDVGFFEALDIGVRSGRVFERTDNRDSEEVVIVNRALAERLFPGRDPVGRRIQALLGTPDEPATIVGVVEDVRTRSLTEPGPPVLYRPSAQVPRGARTLIVTAEGDPLALTAAVREAIWAVHPDVPISDVQSAEQVIRAAAATPRALAILLGIFAAVGIALGLVGVYGTMAYAVGRRRHEIGVRMALGARPGSMVAMVVRTGALLAAAGVALGLIGAALLTDTLEGFVFGVPATDPATYTVLALALGAAVLAAAWIPARGAARVEPTEALRAE